MAPSGILIRGIIEDTATDGNVLTLLDAATNDLAQLITQLNLNATLGTPSPGRGFIGRRATRARPSARCARTPRAIAKAPPNPTPNDYITTAVWISHFSALLCPLLWLSPRLP
ncbi:hypothetical protein B0H13DRAFT_2300424 [Mycena leptocephala]|nr:hypothetical protein B0H13DRAFT_2300424 [Mycena leptocephala]